MADDGPKPKRSVAEIRANVQKLIEAGASEAEINGYLTAEKANVAPPSPITPGHSKFTAQQLEQRAARQVENAQEDLAASPPPDAATKVLGTAASLARDIPGAETAQAGLRSLIRGEPYDIALSNIHGAEDAGGPASTVARIAGGGIAAAALPGSAPLQGARFGVLHGLLQSDPNADLRDRVHDATIEGGVGGLTGALAGIIGSAVRPPTQNALAELVAPQAAVAASEPAIAPALTRETASAEFQKLLQKSLDEGMVARDAVPPTNWALMDKMERGLRPGKRIIPGIRQTTGDLRHLNSFLP